MWAKISREYRVVLQGKLSEKKQNVLSVSFPPLYIRQFLPVSGRNTAWRCHCVRTAYPNSPKFLLYAVPGRVIRIGTYSAAASAASSSVTWGASGLEIFWTGDFVTVSFLALLRRNFPNVPLKIFPRFVRLSPLPILNTSSLKNFFWLVVAKILCS